MLLNSFNEYIEESLTLLKEIVIELKEVKEILKANPIPNAVTVNVDHHDQYSDFFDSEVE